MIDTKELRRLVKAATPGPWKMVPVGDGRQKFAVADSEFLSILTVTDEGDATFGTVYDDADAKFIAAANPATVSELLDRLEAAEKERDALRAAVRHEADCVEAAMAEIKPLRAKVEAMERQEPYAFAVNFPESSRVELVHDLDEAYEDMTYEAYEVRKLYLAPGAQPAPTIAEQDQINAEAAIRSIYGARPNDEALWQTIVNGMITPAHTAQAVADGTIAPAHIMQLAPSIPEGVSFIDTSQLTGVVSTEIVHSYPPPSGWLRAIDEALVATHLGVANAGDTYEQAKAKLDSLIGFHVDVATDPAVNGGWKLVPIEPTMKMVRACASASRAYMQEYGGNSPQVMWAAMLAAAPEAKP